MVLGQPWEGSWTFPANSGQVDGGGGHAWKPGPAPMYSTVRHVGRIFIPFSKEVKDQRSKLMCPQSHSLAAGELYLAPRSLPSTSQDLELQSCTACLLRREIGWRPWSESGSALKP